MGASHISLTNPCQEKKKACPPPPPTGPVRFDNFQSCQTNSTRGGEGAGKSLAAAGAGLGGGGRLGGGGTKAQRTHTIIN